MRFRKRGDTTKEYAKHLEVSRSRRAVSASILKSHRQLLCPKPGVTFSLGSVPLHTVHMPVQPMSAHVPLVAWEIGTSHFGGLSNFLAYFLPLIHFVLLDCIEKCLALHKH